MIRHRCLAVILVACAALVAGTAIASDTTPAAVEAQAEMQHPSSLSPDAKSCSAGETPAVPSIAEFEIEALFEIPTTNLQICFELGDCPGTGSCWNSTCSPCEVLGDCGLDHRGAEILCIYPPRYC